MKAASVIDADLLAFLSRKMGSKSAHTLQGRLTAEQIEKALKDGKRKIDLTWYVENLLAILRDPRGKDKLAVLKELRDLITAGAVQDKEVLRRATAAGSVRSGIMEDDPFVKGKAPKLRIA